MTRIIDPETVGIPPNLWPPALELPNGKWLSQTGVIVDYLSQKFGLAGYPKDGKDLDEEEKVFLSAKHAQVLFTILDLTVEVSVPDSRRLAYELLSELRLQVHNVHHPVSVNFHYEDQKAEASRAAEQLRASRLPKFFQHFQSVLETNPANKDRKGSGLTLSQLLRPFSTPSTPTKVHSYSRTLPQLRTWLCSTT
jgi:glutathione S-transferase